MEGELRTFVQAPPAICQSGISPQACQGGGKRIARRGDVAWAKPGAWAMATEGAMAVAWVKPVGEGDQLLVRETGGVAPHNLSYRSWGVDTSIKSMSYPMV